MFIVTPSFLKKFITSTDLIPNSSFHYQFLIYWSWLEYLVVLYHHSNNLPIAKIIYLSKNRAESPILIDCSYHTLKFYLTVRAIITAICFYNFSLMFTIFPTVVCLGLTAVHSLDSMGIGFSLNILLNMREEKYWLLSILVCFGLTIILMGLT